MLTSVRIKEFVLKNDHLCYTIVIIGKKGIEVTLNTSNKLFFLKYGISLCLIDDLLLCLIVYKLLWQNINSNHSVRYWLRNVLSHLICCLNTDSCNATNNYFQIIKKKIHKIFFFTFLAENSFSSKKIAIFFQMIPN